MPTSMVIAFGLPFDLFESIEHELPWQHQVDPDVGE